MAEMTPCPPWLQSDWQQLIARHQNKKMPHALLITGLPGMGKRLFAQCIAESLLCRQPSDKSGACGMCGSCRQLQADAHADYRRLDPEGVSESIKVDAVRELVQWLQLTTQPNSYKLALLNSADTMNRSAANGLLKTLEEPGERALLILVADRAGALPATVRSRCQTINLRLYDIAVAADWLTPAVEDATHLLQRTPIGPLLLLARQEEAWRATESTLLNAWQDLFLHKASVGRIVDSLSDLSTTQCLQAFLSWTLWAVREQAGLHAGADPATQSAVSAIQGQLSSAQWFTLYDRLLQLHRADSASFKTQAVLEGLFADIRLMIHGYR